MITPESASTKRHIDKMLAVLDEDQMKLLTDAMHSIEGQLTPVSQEIDGCTGQCLDDIPITDVRAGNFAHTRNAHDRALRLSATLSPDVDAPAVMDFDPHLSITAAVTSLGLLSFEVRHPEEEFYLARLTLDDEPWTVAYVEVRENYRRRGIASGLYAHAVYRLGPIAHSAQRTNLGQLWAPTVGGDLPPRRHGLGAAR